MANKKMQFDRWLEHVVGVLKDREFIFVSSDTAIQDVLQLHLKNADAEANNLPIWAAPVLSYLYGIPGPLVSVLSKTMKIQHNTIQAVATEALFTEMKDSFPLSALHIGASSVQFVACYHCSSCDDNDVKHKAAIFSRIIWSIKQHLGTWRAKILGIPISRIQESNVYGSLCLAFTDESVFDSIIELVRNLRIRTMSIGERLQWMKIYCPIWYVCSPPKGEVKIDKIIYRTYCNEIENSNLFHGRGSYGFAVEDLRM